MAIDSPFHGLATELHMTSAIGGTIDGTSLVAEVGSIGTMELTANVIEYNAHGNDYKRKLVGQKDSGTLSLTLNWMAGDTKHTALKTAYDDGSAQTFAVRWVSGAENATAEFTGYISSYSIDTPVEDVVTANVEISIDGAVTMDLATAS